MADIPLLLFAARGLHRECLCATMAGSEIRALNRQFSAVVREAVTGEEELQADKYAAEFPCWNTKGWNQ